MSEYQDNYANLGEMPDAVILDRARVIIGGEVEWFTASPDERKTAIAQAEAERTKMTKSAQYGKTETPVTHTAVIRVPPPDYADIQRLENMVWAASTLATDFHAYAHEYHQLAVKFTEDVVIYCIEQYNRGSRW